jgi:predicted DNA-binding transcriptional regulator AlpA
MELDELVPLPRVWKMFGVSPMTGWRWRKDPRLEFPATIKINNRGYCSRRDLEAWKAKLMTAALKAR